IYRKARLPSRRALVAACFSALDSSSRCFLQTLSARSALQLQSDGRQFETLHLEASINLRRIKWGTWIPIVLGAAGLLTPILLQLGWVPERQALNAVITLLGFLVLDSGLRELRGSTGAPELVESTEEFLSVATRLVRSTEREVLLIETNSTRPRLGK